MTQEEKQLLVKDLCGRLPYWPKVKTKDKDKGYIIGIDNTEEGVFYVHILEDGDSYTCDMPIKNFKPYLRPMSSMTEEDRKEFSIFIGKTETYVQQIRLDADSMANPVVGGFQCVYWGLFAKCVDWLNKNMFDYRGLIPMGLALEAKEGMYD